MEKIHYTYDSITELIKGNINKIIEFNPDYIVAIGGGGLIPARIIRNYIKNHIYVVTLSSYDNEEQKDNIEVIQWIDLKLKDKKVLIIDEIDDTRKTLHHCIQRLKLVNNANNIGVFVLQNKIKSKISDISDITYMSCEDIEDKRVVYPWD